MRVEWTDELMVKLAESDDDRRSLGEEAAVLAAVAHPAVVRMAAVKGEQAPDRPDRLALHRVPGTDLSEVGTQPDDLIAGWGAAVATVLADMHDLGFFHGRVRAEHVLIDGHGRPLLCGFASAGRVASTGGKGVEEDISDLARLLLETLEPGHPVLQRLLRRWQEGRHRRRRDARALARALIRRVPEARVGPPRPRHPAAAGTPRPGASEPLPGPGLTGTGRSLGRRGAVVVAGTVVAIGFVVAALAAWHGNGPGRALSAGGPTAAVGVSGPTAPAYVLRSVPHEDTVTVVGRWGCGPYRPAVLDTRSGAIWTYPAWPGPGEAVAGTLLARVASASGLSVVSTRPGCDQLLVVRSGRPGLSVRVPGG